MGPGGAPGGPPPPPGGKKQPPGPAPGDWVIVHVGFALQVIDPQKAAETLAAMETVSGCAQSGAAP